MVTNDDLFRVFDSFVPEGWKTRYQVKRPTKNVSGNTVIIPNNITITIKSAWKPVRTEGGEYRTRYKRVIFTVYSDRGTYEAIRSGQSVCEDIQEKLIDLYNKSVEIILEDGTPKKVWITDCEITNDIDYVGMNEQGVHIHSMEYKVTY